MSKKPPKRPQRCTKDRLTPASIPKKSAQEAESGTTEPAISREPAPPADLHAPATEPKPRIPSSKLESLAKFVGIVASLGQIAATVFLAIQIQEQRRQFTETQAWEAAKIRPHLRVFGDKIGLNGMFVRNDGLGPGEIREFQAWLDESLLEPAASENWVQPLRRAMGVLGFDCVTIETRPVGRRLAAAERHSLISVDKAQECSAERLKLSSQMLDRVKLRLKVDICFCSVVLGNECWRSCWRKGETKSSPVAKSCQDIKQDCP